MVRGAGNRPWPISLQESERVCVVEGRWLRCREQTLAYILARVQVRCSARQVGGWGEIQAGAQTLPQTTLTSACYERSSAMGSARAPCARLAC